MGQRAKKRRVFFAVIISLWGVFACFASDSPEIKVEAVADKDEVTVGDKIKYEIKIQCRRDVETDILSLWKDLTDVDIVDSGKSESGISGDKKINYWYSLQNFRTESFVIPKVSVRYRGKNDKDWRIAETNEINIAVKSLLTSQDADIKDIKPPLAPKSSFLVLFFLAIIFAVIGGWWLLSKRYFLKKEEKVILKEPAYVTALRKLNLLKNKNLPRSGKIEEYYVELSGIVRVYIEERFNIRAPEMTTEEFLYHLKGQTILNPGQKNMLRDFLSATDKVKFARFQPQEQEIEESFAAAYKFVEETKIAANNQ